VIASRIWRRKRRAWQSGPSNQGRRVARLPKPGQLLVAEFLEEEKGSQLVDLKGREGRHPLSFIA
jgi:hypothetical protein